MTPKNHKRVMKLEKVAQTLQTIGYEIQKSKDVPTRSEVNMLFMSLADIAMALEYVKHQINARIPDWD